MRSYVIDRYGDSWVVRLFEPQDAMIVGPTAESAKEQAFERLRQWAPCRSRVTGDVSEEWTLEHPEGAWEKTE